MRILLKMFSFLLVAGAMVGCSKNDDEDGGGSNWKPNLGDYDPVPLSDFDNAFYKWCVSKFDATGDGILQYGEIKTIKKLDFNKHYDNAEFESLRGIKYFTSLTYLWDYNGWTCKNMETLDVSHNLMLDTLRLGNKPKLRSLILGNKPYLEYLTAESSLFTSLDVTKCPKLKELVCTSYALNSLDVTKNTALERLNCYHSLLTSLDVSKNTQLKELSVPSSLQILYVWKGCDPSKWSGSYLGNVQIIEK